MLNIFKIILTIFGKKTTVRIGLYRIIKRHEKLYGIRYNLKWP